MRRHAQHAHKATGTCGTARSGDARYLHRILAVLAALLLFVGLALPGGPAFAEPTGVIDGKLTNQTAGGTLPAQVPVELQVYKGMTREENRAGVSDEQGKFQFDKLETGEDYNYQVLVRYKGATYVSDMVSLTANPKPDPFSIAVYEPSSDKSRLLVQRAHVILNVTPRSLQVGQLFVFSNPGDHVLIGGDGTGSGPTLDFPLPAGATGLQFQDGELGDRYITTPGGFADTWPVLPGEGSHSVLYQYGLSFDGPSLTLSITAPYTVTALNVLVSDPAVKVTSADLRSDGIRNMQSEQWQSLSADAVPPGKVFTIQMDNLPLEARAGAAPDAAPGSTAAASRRNLSLPPEHLILFGALLFVLGVVAGRVLPAVWGQPSPAPAGAASVKGTTARSADEDKWIVALADLDDAYERGELPEEEYRVQRDRIKREIADRSASKKK